MAENQNVVVMDQWASDAVVEHTERLDLAKGTGVPAIETPLYHAELPAVAAVAAPQAGVQLRELPLTGLLTIRAQAGNPGLSKSLRAELSLELPAALQTRCQGPYCLRWMSPDEWLLSAPVNEIFDIENRLRNSIGTPMAIVNVTGGYTLLELSGTDSLNVLKKCTSYDCHPRNLPIGKVVNTVFAKSQVGIRCVAQQRYELLVRRSFADYIWLWLQTACREYGLQVLQ